MPLNLNLTMAHPQLDLLIATGSLPTILLCPQDLLVIDDVGLTFGGSAHEQ